MSATFAKRLELLNDRSMAPDNNRFLVKKWINTYVLSLRGDILNMLLADAILLLPLELVFKQIPAPYPFFVTFGNIVETLLISFIASFIFYFVQVHMPETKQKEDLYPSIAALYFRILHTEKSLLYNFVGANSYEELNEDIIKAGARARDVNIQDAPLILAGLERNANWLEYGFNAIEEIDKTWEMIMKYSTFLDSECLSLLSRLQSGGVLGVFRALRGIYRTLKNGVNIEGIENEFVTFWHFVQVQDDYYNRVFAPYKV